MKNKRVLSGFWANLLGIILGIMLTFGINSLWQKHEEKKKTREMLILVRNELMINKEWFKKQETHIRKDSYAYKKILEANGNWDNIPIDTLLTYCSRTNTFTFSMLSGSAWQIFQNSETIQKIDNKELVIRLAECYFWINQAREILEQEYWNKKRKTAVENTVVTHPSQYLDALTNNNQTVAFYTALANANGNQFQNLFIHVDATIDYTILLLDKYGDYRYDMDNKDKEYDSFIEARQDSILQQHNTTENKI
jgi:hypothetical protein